MAELHDEHWEPSFDGPTRSARKGGRYRTYCPDELAERPLSIDTALSFRAQEVEAGVRRLATSPRSRCLEGLARFLLRSEALASSRIEGLQVSAQQVALAELAQTDQTVTRGFTGNAALVANNIHTLKQATTALAAAPRLDIPGIDALHHALLPDEKHQGLRTVQNWIDGNDWSPVGADFVPPSPELVEPLMRDLAGYLNGGAHAPLVQAALAHAQFETIHPYTDGNGRVGRALIHTVLVRRGLTPAAVLPISLVLLTHSRAYLDGLNAYRYLGTPTSAAAKAGVSAWLATFLEAAAAATTQAGKFTDAIEDLTRNWQRRLAEYRSGQGVRSQPRANSASAKLLVALPEIPVLTTRTAERALGVSFPAARTALEEFAEAGILKRKQVDRGTTGYLANEVFDLLTFAERELASTQWDTRKVKPGRVVPARPQG
ncbi:Fic family protein [Amycolatopsis albispora]|uniref:Cell filamentation protein Fic n=1 Tax=Amycolatopsis albispora TaxID=1804986 RepID=A0A344LBF5_9PSEU|nr:Fic family protein [Amycolatopsis albispora]AXB45379.1 cell filamentation protein Fic [Amycolatopsis albispora]